MASRGDRRPSLDVAAFAEAGKPLSTPGPVIRVPVGTEVHATLRNRLDKPLIVNGFGKTRGLSDSVIVPVNGTTTSSSRRRRRARTTTIGKAWHRPAGLRLAEDLQLNGVIVVDPPNAPKVADRIFVISWWTRSIRRASRARVAATMAINGLSWPHTERLTYAQGDSVHWRVINLTEIDHPMHLHGFYFRMDSKGNGVTDSLYTPDQQRMAVTEMINPFETMSLSWLPDRPGNWIYHCHYATHLSTLVSLDTEKGELDESHAARITCPIARIRCSGS